MLFLNSAKPNPLIHILIRSLYATTSNGYRIPGSSLGERDLSPEQVGQDAANELMKELDHGAPVDSYTQDQVIVD